MLILFFSLKILYFVRHGCFALLLNFLRYSIKLLLILVTGGFATHSLLPPVLPHSSHSGPVAGVLKPRKEPEEEEHMDRKRAEAKR